MAVKAELVLETAKEIIITILQTDGRRLLYQNSEEKIPAGSVSKNISEHFKIITTGVMEAYEIANK